MTATEIYSLIAILISFTGIIVSWYYSHRKLDKERTKEHELNVQNITSIQKDISAISKDIADIRMKINKLDQQMYNDHEKIVEHDNRIKHLEKTVFKKGE